MSEGGSECLLYKEARQNQILVWSVGSRGRAPKSTPGNKLLPLPECYRGGEGCMLST